MSQSTAAKEKREREAFAAFADRIPDGSNWISWESRPWDQPDLLCQQRFDGPIAFELVAIVDSRIAELLSVGSKASTTAIWTEDPTKRILTKKLSSKYTTPYPIHLLIYTDGALVSTDDMVKPTILELVTTTSHPFRKVWFNGEDSAELLWSGE